MNRDKLIAKIKALRELTAARGCTEAEAMAAAEKAAALMAEHAIDPDQLEIRDQETPVKSTLKTGRSKIWAYVAHATNCAMIHLSNDRDYRVVYVGREPGPEIACYLREVCDRAIDQGVAEFKQGAIYKARRATSTRRKAVEDFTAGMVERLGTRVIKMFGETISRAEFDKARVVRDAMFPGGKDHRQKEHKARFQEASSAGHSAGDKVHLARGVKETAPVALIGGRS